MKISIIIPCKDRAENTKHILNELCKQLDVFPQTEIIVIENGSTEDMSFLDNYNFEILHETQKGVAHARNVGLDKVSGDYICFIDNDDSISSDYLKEIYEHLNDDYDWITWQWKSDDTLISMDDLDLKNPLKSNWALWGYCFKKSLFDGIRFDETKLAGEDLIVFDIITEKTIGYFIKKPLYNFKWDGNEDSLSHLYNKGLLN